MGEFSFVLARMGVASQSIDANLYSLFLSIAIVTMVMTPLVSRLTVPVYALQKRWRKNTPLETMHISDEDMRGHVVIVGGGRVGQYVGHVLKRLKEKFVVIEQNFHQVEQIKAAGMSLVYGDAAQEVVLEGAGVDKARLLLVTTPAIVTSQTVLRLAKHANPAIRVITMADSLEQMKMLKESGTCDVVMPKFEAGLEFARQALMDLHIPATEIQSFTNAVRLDMYAPLYRQPRRVFHAGSIGTGHESPGIDLDHHSPKQPHGGKKSAGPANPHHHRGFGGGRGAQRNPVSQSGKGADFSEQ